MKDDSIIIQRPYVDDEGRIRIKLYKLFCVCHSAEFEFKGDSHVCKKCGALMTYRMPKKEEEIMLEAAFRAESETIH